MIGGGVRKLAPPRRLFLAKQRETVGRRLGTRHRALVGPGCLRPCHRSSADPEAGESHELSAGAQFTPKELPDPDELITEAAIRRETPAKMVSDADETERKTLNCDECETLNRPTEWYCESCGAELAAL